MTILNSLFQCDTLNKHPHGDAVKRILTAAMQSVEPGAAIHQFVKRENELLLINDYQLALPSFDHIYIIAFGKAAGAMADAIVALLGDSLTAGWVITKHAYLAMDSRIQSMIGGHPVPDANSLKAGEMLVDVSEKFKANDLVFCLISGGGSALVTGPYEGISLADMQTLTSQLLACGARIDEINCLRRHLDRVKGGGLAKLVSPARVVSLILSDVVNSPLEAIASGATAPDPSTKEEALEILDRYQLDDQVPVAILKHLKNGAETPKPGDEIFEIVENLLVASNELAARAAARQAAEDGFKIELLGYDWQGEAREVAATLVAKLNSMASKPLCMIAGGETTVTIHGNGKGGRNQELALAAVALLDGFPGLMLVTLATDGEDGPTDAAGAVVTGKTKEEGLKLGLDPALFLANNDAYHYFQALGDLLKPGPTGTNVNDLTFLFRF